MKKTSPLFLFLIFGLLGIAIFLSTLVFSSGAKILEFIWNADTYGLFPDFFESIRDASLRDPYGNKAIYPPITYCVLYIFSLLIPNGSSQDWESLSSLATSHFLVFFFYGLITYFIILLVSSKLKLKPIASIFFLLIFIFSPGFLFMFERGNIVIISMMFLMVYLCWYDSPNSVQREIALISLALAFCFKLYPVVFGLLLITDKRWKAALRCALYGVVLFFLPFTVMGGFSAIRVFIQNIINISVSTAENGRGFGYGFKINVSNFYDALCEWLHISNTFGTVVLILSFVWIILLFFIAKKRWQKVFALTLFLTIIPGFSFIYNAVYFLLPLTFFLDEEHHMNGYNFIYTTLFSLSFSSLPFGFILPQLNGANKINTSTTMVFVSALLISLFILLENILSKKYFPKKVR